MRIVYLTSSRPISWVGVAIDSGTRDELPDECGMAHFVEHMLFKGTARRHSYHIISRLESIGGQLDAYTTKEETYVYATIPTIYTDRALELLADITLHSTFPAHEIERERDVVLDEIQSYNDSPSELIYDEYESLLYPTDTIGRNILGTEESLNKMTSHDLLRYTGRMYRANRMTVFYMGAKSDNYVLHQIERHFAGAPAGTTISRSISAQYTPFTQSFNRDTYQAHCLIGNRCCSMSDSQRHATILLNNILGGPSMVSRLNLAVRERNGLCYNIESNTNFYTDTGVWTIYFGCDHRNMKRALHLCMRQMALLRDKPLSDRQLRLAKQQLRGQVLIANENLENMILGISKTVLHNIPLRSDDEQLKIIDSLSAADIRHQAQILFDPDRLSTLQYIDN